jgi:hypothetical protein
MLLGIWLIPCQWVSGLNPLQLRTLDFADTFTRDATQKYGEISLGFPCKVFCGIYIYIYIYMKTHVWFDLEMLERQIWRVAWCLDF